MKPNNSNITRCEMALGVTSCAIAPHVTMSAEPMSATQNIQNILETIRKESTLPTLAADALKDGKVITKGTVRIPQIRCPHAKWTRVRAYAFRFTVLVQSDLFAKIPQLQSTVLLGKPLFDTSPKDTFRFALFLGHLRIFFSPLSE